MKLVGSLWGFRYPCPASSIIQNERRCTHKGTGILDLEVLPEAENKFAVSIFIIGNESKLHFHGAKNKILISGSEAAAKAPVEIMSFYARDTIHRNHINLAEQRDTETQEGPRQNRVGSR